MRRGVHLKGYLYVGLASLMWGSTAAVTRLLLDGLSNLQVLTVSALFSLLTLAAVSASTGRTHLLTSYSAADYARFAAMAMLGVFMYRFLFQESLQYIPAQEAFIVNYTWPLMVVVCAAILLGERFTLRAVAAMGCSLFGVVIIATNGHIVFLELSLEGIGLAVGAAFVFGLFSALAKRHDDDRLASTTLYYGFTFIYALAATLATSHLPSLSAAQVGGLTWLGVSSGLAYACWGLALKHGDTARMSNLVFITPFISAVYVYFLVGEPIHVWSLVGLAVVVVGIVVQSRSTASRTDGHATMRFEEPAAPIM